MLSGTIELNGIAIGGWQATNTRETHGEFNDYECEFWIRKQDGYLYTAHWFIWGHHHGNGAASLGARVMQEGNAKAKRKVIITEESVRPDLVASMSFEEHLATEFLKKDNDE